MYYKPVFFKKGKMTLIPFLFISILLSCNKKNETPQIIEKKSISNATITSIDIDVFAGTPESIGIKVEESGKTYDILLVPSSDPTDTTRINIQEPNNWGTLSTTTVSTTSLQGFGLKNVRTPKNITIIFADKVSGFKTIQGSIIVNAYIDAESVTAANNFKANVTNAITYFNTIVPKTSSIKYSAVIK